MLLDSLRSMVSRRPGWVVGFWFAVAAAVGLLAPDLTRLAAEGQAKLLARDAESLRAATVVGQAWPDQSYESLAVVALHRPGGLTPADLAYARRLADRIGRPAAPDPCSGSWDRASTAEIAERLREPRRHGPAHCRAPGQSFVVPPPRRRSPGSRRSRTPPSLAPPPGWRSTGRATR